MKVTLLLLLSLTLLLGAVFAAPTLTETDKINALITRVESLSDAKFVRNESPYDAKTAGKFLREKWKSRAREIKTVEDFIGKVASISSTSGKPYVIRFADGHEEKCGDFLRTELKKIAPAE